MRNKERRLEISSKLLQIGQSLVEEGQNSGDKNISYNGTSLILLAGVMLNDEDMKLFADLCSMFSAKKVLESMMGTPSEESLNRLKNDDLGDVLRRLADDNERRNNEKSEDE